MGLNRIVQEIEESAALLIASSNRRPQERRTYMVSDLSGDLYC
jgi:hypothetical protein